MMDHYFYTVLQCWTSNRWDRHLTTIQLATMLPLPLPHTFPCTTLDNPNITMPLPCTETGLQAIAPASHTASAATSTLCKVLTWHLAHTWQDAAAAGATPRLMHQADWLAYLLHGTMYAACRGRHRSCPCRTEFGQLVAKMQRNRELL
jgi:hypothetical protein